MATATADKTLAESAIDAADAAQEEARSTLRRLRAQADEVVDRMKPKLDAVTTYVRDEPTKSMLASAAVGAGVMALLVLLTRTGSRPPPVRSTALKTIRDAALDLADRAHLAANDALARTRSRSHGLFAAAESRADAALAAAQRRADQAHVQARDRAESAAVAAQSLGDDAVDAARQKAGEANEAAGAALADAWQSIRDQADPMIDRFRPQLESAARYAREEPARAALGVAAAGAVLLGLAALARSATRD